MITATIGGGNTIAATPFPVVMITPDLYRSAKMITLDPAVITLGLRKVIFKVSIPIVSLVWFLYTSITLFYISGYNRLFILFSLQLFDKSTYKRR